MSGFGGFGGFGQNNNTQQNTGFGGFGQPANTNTGMSISLINE
jgi:nuclear pore complex protein Nup98-Nup96